MKAQQAAHQAAVKASGNTFTASGMTMNIACCAYMIFGGAILIPSGFAKLYYGAGKIVLPAED